MTTNVTSARRFSLVAKCVPVALLGAGFGYVFAAFPLTDLSSFYTVYTDPRPKMCSPEIQAAIESNQAEVHIVGGAQEPASRPSACDGKTYLTVHRLVDLSRDNFGVLGGTAENATKIAYGDQRWFEPCGGSRRLLRSSAAPDPSESTDENYREPWRGDVPVATEPISFGGERCETSTIGGNPPPKFMIKSDYTAASPKRRRAIDGSEYDASSLTIKREGVSWYTHYWGYRLGLVASESDFVEADRAKFPSDWTMFPSAFYNFELAKLPAPRVEETVIEYVNRAEFPDQPDGQYFYAVRDDDKSVLDSLPNWQRTGNSFKSGGYVSVCRFYGGLNGGPNTHFYSADSAECVALRAIPQLSYEGQTFAANMPMPAKTQEQAIPGALRDCPQASKPLFRLYNNASQSGGRFASNHRYTTERVDVAAFVAKGWVDEGHVMCVPN